MWRGTHSGSSMRIVRNPAHETVPTLWWVWLLVVSVAGSIGGLVLALGSPLYEPALSAIYEFVFGVGSGETLSAADRVMLSVALAIGAGVLLALVLGLIVLLQAS